MKRKQKRKYVSAWVITSHSAADELLETSAIRSPIGLALVSDQGALPRIDWHVACSGARTRCPSQFGIILQIVNVFPKTFHLGKRSQLFNVTFELSKTCHTYFLTIYKFLRLLVHQNTCCGAKMLFYQNLRNADHVKPLRNLAEKFIAKLCEVCHPSMG